MSVLMVSLFFVACEKDNDQPTLQLNFDPATIEVVAEGDAATVNVTGGTAPYVVEIAEAEEGAEVIKATIEDSKITIEGLAEGETTITVTDKDGIKGEIKVTVTAKAEEGEGEGEE